MKKLLKYLKEYHVDIYTIMIERSLKNNKSAFYYDIETEKLFKYNIKDIEYYYKGNYKDFSWNALLIENFLYNANNFDIKIYSNYNNFLSVKKFKKLINNDTDTYYRNTIKKELNHDFNKTTDKKKKNTIANLKNYIMNWKKYKRRYKKMKYEYLLIKRNGNKNGLVYDKRFFNNSADTRKDFRKNDILLKCKLDSVYRDSFGWSVNQTDVVRKYEK